MAKKKKVTGKATKAATKAKTPARAKAPTVERADFSSLKSANKPRTKSEIMALLANCTGMNKKDVTNLFNALGELIGLDIGKKGPGLFTVPGLMKITRIHKPATKSRKGINPFTGLETVFKAKPARNVVKVRPLKALKEMV